MSTSAVTPDQQIEEDEREFRIGLRAAILHLIHLAAGYEQRGLPAPLDEAALQRDYSALGNVVQKLLDHREQAMKRRRKAVMQHLAQLVAPLYERYSKDASMTQDDLARECRTLLDARGVEYDPTWIKKLAIERSELSAGNHKGPVETARYVVCERLFGHSAAVLRDGQPPEQRAAHAHPNHCGQVVSKAVARRYIEQIFEWQPPPEHGEGQLANLLARGDEEIRHALESHAQILWAAATMARGQAVDVAEIPALRRFAPVDRAVKDQLLKEELSRLARFDPAFLDELSRDENLGSFLEEVLQRWDGKSAPPLTYTTGVKGDVEMYPSRATRKAAGAKKPRSSPRKATRKST